MTTWEAKQRANRLVAGFIRGWLEAGALTSYIETEGLGEQAHDAIAAELDGIMVTLRAREIQCARADADAKK